MTARLVNRTGLERDRREIAAARATAEPPSLDSVDTVRAHIESGAVSVRKRTTEDDLRFAAEWLEAFETEDPTEVASLAAVARKLRAEADRRTA